ncbi:hypothetical protein [Paenarthrobacter nitroguajacolicus]|uniref:hypothetical protein n=1 Tax=Paenarthrobacter nitroguajacolicus TaxID=211146 RepID=UPI00248B8A8A|nr:hypothetical protein [Paenarthrobacter nitroguajacolicus]MDI2033929.1 hypothetical protein [Paenarthrobacter nitroguajacolicus]
MKRNIAAMLGVLALFCLLAAAAVISGTKTPGPVAGPAPGSPTPRSTSTHPPGMELRNVDGGVGFYSRFTNPLPSEAHFFPIGVWFESALEKDYVAKDLAAGLNTYVVLTPDSDLDLVRTSGMYAIPTYAAAKASGYALGDEVDMWGGAGDSQWTGNHPGQGPICSPEESKCGYTVQDQLRAAAPPGIMTYANYGKGVTFWLSDEQSRTFVTEKQDVVSADNYWFTDPNICTQTEGGALVGGANDLTEDQCRLAANYGWTVERIRKLTDGKAPVWAFVEVGHPFADGPQATTISAPEIRAAVWSSLIHGARGIIYFNHSFGGDCVTQHVLRDCPGEVRPAVTAVNQQITSLAPVLNAPFLDGATTASGPVDHATKLYDSGVYVFAGANKSTGGTATFTLKCGGSTAVVIDENRTIPIVDGTFTDSFADGNAVHLYSIEGGGSCGY